MSSKSAGLAATVRLSTLSYETQTRPVPFRSASIEAQIMKKRREFGHWLVEFTPEDGARLNRLAFDGIDLLTTEPDAFRPPASDLGEYENRPVYGYDDCFPTVEPCRHPGMEWDVPDHGELCWLSWDFSENNSALRFGAASKALPARFTRELVFDKSRLTWKFEVMNTGEKEISFQHVMHPLVRLDEIAGLKFPGFGSAFNAATGRDLGLNSAADLERYLLTLPYGTANMLFLREIESGEVGWTYESGATLTESFPKQLFPTIGIWWNNRGYPDETGIRRCECAFEPVPGSTSTLAEAYEEGLCLTVRPGSRLAWEISWDLSR